MLFFQMGYGRRALKLLKNYYSGKFTSLDENEDGEDDDSDDNGKKKFGLVFHPF